MTNYIIWLAITAALVLSVETADAKSLAPKNAAQAMRRHRLPLPEQLRASLARRLAAKEETRRRFGLIGLGVGAVAGLGSVIVGHEQLVSILTMFPALIGLALGAASAAARFHESADPNAPRVARTRATGLEDYVTDHERRASWMALGSIVLAAVVVVALWALSPVSMSAVRLILPLALAVLGFSLLLRVARKAGEAVDQPQRASSDLELAWDDALRAHSVREVLDMVTLSGLTVSLIVLLQMAPWVIWMDDAAQQREAAGVFGPTGLVVAAACWIVVGVVWTMGRTKPNPSRDALWAGREFHEEAVHAAH